MKPLSIVGPDVFSKNDKAMEKSGQSCDFLFRAFETFFHSSMKRRGKERVSLLFPSFSPLPDRFS